MKIMMESLAMLTMPKKERIVVLQVDVPESFRTRLRIEALKLGITMGELIILQFSESPLKRLERKDDEEVL